MGIMQLSISIRENYYVLSIVLPMNCNHRKRWPLKRKNLLSIIIIYIIIYISFM